MEITLTNYFAISAPDRASLVAFATPGLGGYPQLHTQQKPFLQVSLPCGRTRTWVLPEWIPETDVECKCDELPHRHFFIKYTGKIEVPSEADDAGN